MKSKRRFLGTQFYFSPAVFGRSLRCRHDELAALQIPEVQERVLMGSARSRAAKGCGAQSDAAPQGRGSGSAEGTGARVWGTTFSSFVPSAVVLRDAFLSTFGLNLRVLPPPVVG